MSKGLITVGRSQIIATIISTYNLFHNVIFTHNYYNKLLRVVKIQGWKQIKPNQGNQNRNPSSLYN